MTRMGSSCLTLRPLSCLLSGQVDIFGSGEVGSSYLRLMLILEDVQSIGMLSISTKWSWLQNRCGGGLLLLCSRLLNCLHKERKSLIANIAF
jgi:hypothetical protein